MSETIPADVVREARGIVLSYFGYVSSPGVMPDIQDMRHGGLVETIARALMAEREKAARIADAEYRRHNTGSGFDSQPAGVAAYEIAAAIRRGQE